MNLEKYINIPYKHLGHSLDGADCWGLVWLIYKEEKNIELPEIFTYQEFWYKEKEDKNPLLQNMSSYKNKKFLLPSDVFNTFDVLMFFNSERTYVDHIGLVLDENRFLHTYRGTSSRIDRLQGYWNSRLYGGIRYDKKKKE